MTRTEQIDSILQQVIEGENLDVMLTALSPADQNLFYDLIAELRETGDLGMEDLWSIDYLRKPPTMEEFVDDPYWLGDVAKHADDNEGIYPAWRDIVCRDFNLDSRLHNVVITGSLGCGKSWVSALIMCYRIVLCRLLRNPMSFLDLSKGSPIVFALLSVTRSAVQETIYSDVMNFMAHSAFFKEECKYNIEKRYAALRIPLGNNMMLVAGSQGQHVIGKNTLAVTMDEGNWRREANPDEKAYKLYDEIRHRITGRFQKVAGFMPGICLLSSSARDESSFTEQVIADIAKVNDERTQRIYRLAGYEVKSHLLQLRPRRFKVAFGLKTLAPRILQGWYDKNGTLIEGQGEESPAGARVRLVPEDYLPDFKRNITTSLQSICGETTGGAFRLFSDFSIVEEAVGMGEAAGLVNPCNVLQVPLSNDDTKEMWDFLDHKKFIQRQLGRFLPKRDPGQPRFAHYDLATVNQAGLSICHVAGRKLVEGMYDVKSGQVFAQYRPLVEYDFILAIVPGEQKEMSLIKIQNFLFWLRDRCGYSFGMVTADSFQSQMPLELLEVHGFEVDLLSMDKTKDAYYSWRMGFSEHLIRMFRHPILMAEAENLQDMPKKIDHPTPGTKDVADSACGAYFNAVRLGLGSIGADGAVPDFWTERRGDQPPPPIEFKPPAEQIPVHSFEG